MKTVAIISEYNPFHSGHEYQIKKIREELGADTRIIAIMSGNYTQRGEVAFLDKSVRAECAVRCGVNLVLELPFPFSSSSAEFFAKSGVTIADSIGVVDTISFGSESGDISLLSAVAKNMSAAEYKSALADMTSSTEYRLLGYPVICEKVYKKLFGEDLPEGLFSPNNILAIEYIKAIADLKSSILPHTVKRSGAGYSESSITDSGHQSATALREIMSKNPYSAFKYIPDNAKNTIISAFDNGQAPCDGERLSSAVISSFRLSPTTAGRDIHDTAGGLYNRLRNASFGTNSISTLTELTDTKKYTSARIRRAIWYSFFGVTSSTVRELPRYTTALAMDSVGKAILKEIKKVADFPVVTKPSSFARLSDVARRQKELSDRADSIFQLTKPTSVSGNYSLTTGPFVLD